MSCFRSFILDYDINGSLTTIAGATNTFYLSNSNPCVSTIIRGPVSPSPGLVVQFLPQGFKNIDIYAIKLIGTVQSNPSSTNNGVVDNWGVEVNAVGTYGEIGGIYSGPFGLLLLKTFKQILKSLTAFIRGNSKNFWKGFHFATKEKSLTD